MLEYPETTGNLLFAAADGEAYSAGMRGAVGLFTRWGRQTRRAGPAVYRQGRGPVSITCCKRRQRTPAASAWESALFGPIGMDAHQMSERVRARSLLEDVPVILQHFIEQMFANT